jgi:hypothetical protein
MTILHFLKKDLAHLNLKISHRGDGYEYNPQRSTLVSSITSWHAWDGLSTNSRWVLVLPLCPTEHIARERAELNPVSGGPSFSRPEAPNATKKLIVFQEIWIEVARMTFASGERWSPC